MVNRNLIVWVLIFIAVIGLFNLYRTTGNINNGVEFTYSDFLSHVNQSRIQKVIIDGHNIRGTLKSGQTFSTYAPDDPELISKLEASDAQIQALPPDEGIPTLLAILIQWFPMLLFVGIWIFFMRQMNGGGRGGAMGFGKSRAKKFDGENSKTTFEDVAGIEEAKAELTEIVEYLRNPKKFQKLGGKIPKGVLLIGPPGTGKTLVARAVAGEAGVPFYSISGSDFVEMFVGVGASRVRDLFQQGKDSAPCIIFIDEIDAVGRHRGAGLGGGNDEREQTLNQILVEMDGFDEKETIILIAATNRPDVLDPALLRPGRFDRQVIVSSPDIKGREQILEVHSRDIPLAGDVDVKTIARGTPGFSGADLMNLVNEAALMAARRSRRRVSMKEFEDAKDKVMMGSERRSLVMSEDEKKLTAYHEAGHAVVMLHAKGHEPLHKVTIIPRGRALGVTFALPERDKLSQSEKELRAQLASLFGGRIAEEIIFGKENITTGAGSDIQQATRIARRMVTEFGFSDKLGRLRYSDNEEEVFLGHSVAQRKNVSDATAKLIDEEVRRFVEEGEKTASEILNKYRDELEIIAQNLLEHETLSRHQIDRLLKGQSLDDDTTPSQEANLKAGAIPKAGKQPKPDVGQAIPEPSGA